MKEAYSIKDTNKDEFQKLLMRGYSIEAFAFHFFTDYFTAGHFRVPRRQFYNLYQHDFLGGNELSGLLAKYHHDEDGEYGLNFTNSKGHKWKVYGDTKLLDDVEGNEIQGREVIQLAMQSIIDELYEVAINGKEASENPGFKFLPQLTGENTFPLFKIKNGTDDVILRRSNVSDPYSNKYISDWTLIGTHTELLTATKKKKSDRLVERNDTIILYLNYKEVETITWSEYLKSKNATYIVLPFTVENKESYGVVFIENDRYDKFIQDCIEADDNSYKAKVTDIFQYGEDTVKVNKKSPANGNLNSPL